MNPCEFNVPLTFALMLFLHLRQNVFTTIASGAMKFFAYILVPLRMNCFDFSSEHHN